MFARRLGVVCLAAFFLTFWLDAAGQQAPPLSAADLERLRTQVAGRDLSTAPPKLMEATVEPLSTPSASVNAVLRVRFEAREVLPARLNFRDGSVINTLADDGRGVDARAGDGVYTALGTLDQPAFRRSMTQLAQSATAQPTTVFSARSKGLPAPPINTAGFQPGKPVAWMPWGEPTTISAARSLLVRDPSVVQDPSRTLATCGGTSLGPWSFGYLMNQMANKSLTGVSGAQFARQLLDTWTADRVVNGQTIAARPLITDRLITPWVTASGGPGAPLDLSKAPFRLLAIVNRVDLRAQSAYGGGHAGELRFVFSAMQPSCLPLPNFLVILEFGVPKSGCFDIKAWAQQWKDLALYSTGSAAYNAALEGITQQVVVANADPSKPNGSAINQIRTNENAIDPSGGIDWETREFAIHSRTHLPVMVTVKQTPVRQQLFAGNETLGDYVNANADDIKDNTHQVPLQYPAGTPFRGGSAIYGFLTLWDRTAAPNAIVDREARHQFALQTCSGCHRRETDTSFTHVKPAAFGAAVTLSSFMTGGWVADPADGAPSRYFDELQRRATDMDALLIMPCFLMPLDAPLKAVH